MILLAPLKRLLDKSKLKSYFLIVPVFALAIVALTLALQKHAKPQDYDSCGTLLHHGQWLRNDTKVDASYWQPQDCTLHEYGLDDIATCMKPNSRIIFFGDSTARQIFWATANLLDNGIRPDYNVHGNIYFERRNITVHLLWDPYLDSSESFGVIKKMAQDATQLNQTTYLYITTGLWQAMFKPRNKVMKAFRKSVDDVVDVLKSQVPGAFGSVYFGPTQLPQYPLLDKNRNKKITHEYISQMHNYTDYVFNYNPAAHSSEHGNNGTLYTNDGRVAAYYTPVFNRYGPGHLSLYDKIGLHYLDTVISLQAQTMINHHCNGKFIKPESFPHETTCCIPYQQPTSTHKFMIFLVLGLSLVLTLLVFVPERLSSLTLQSAVSIITMSVLSALYAYLCDRTHQVNKQYNILSWYEFFALAQLFIAVTGFTVSRARSVSVAQTTFLRNTILTVEWKGLAIGLWLLTKLTGLAKEYNEGAVFCRILEASLIFTETYEFALATMSREVGMFRFVSQLLRINVMSVLLAWTLDTSYFFYALPAKISFWYIFVYVGYGILNGEGMTALLARILRRDATTTTGTVSGGPNFLHDLVKLGGLTLAFGFGILVFWTPFSEKLIEYSVDLKDEFWVGVAAVASSLAVTNGPLVSAAALHVQSRSFRIMSCSVAGVVGIVLINLCFFSGAFVSPEQYMRSLHQISTLGFISVYVVFRSCLLGSMAKDSFFYSAFLEHLGSCWLEMFVLSYHTYLAGDGTLRLYLLTTGTTDDTPFHLNMRRVANFALLTVIFILVSRRIAGAWENLQNGLSGIRKVSRTTMSAASSDESLSPYALELYEIEDKDVVGINKKDDDVSASEVLASSSTSDSSDFDVTSTESLKKERE